LKQAVWLEQQGSGGSNGEDNPMKHTLFILTISTIYIYRGKQYMVEL
jgi:hypothetical protein